MNTKLCKTLNEILDTLSKNDKLPFNNNDLFSFSDGKILTPVGDVVPLLLNHKSRLKDEFVGINILENFVNLLTKKDSIISLNHIGFCYKVASQETEKDRLIKLIKDSNFHLYQEPSNDAGIWLFIGNTDKWENPMVEIIPVEKTNDKWVDYWLPHIQIDIDTTLSTEEIEKTVSLIFGRSVFPFSIVIDGTVYIVRNRLGTIDGVNITLDLATNSRDIKYLRQNILKRIDVG